MHTLPIQGQQAGTLFPDITALLWNPPRLLYCYQEKVYRHSCEKWTTPIPIWLALSIQFAGRHGTWPRQRVPFIVWPPSACAKRLLLRVGQKTSRLLWCSGSSSSPRNSLWRRSVSVMWLGYLPKHPYTLNGLYSFVQNNNWTGFLCTSLNIYDLWFIFVSDFTSAVV